MLRPLALFLLFCCTLSAQAQETRGAWTADASDIEAGKIHFQLTRRHSNQGQTMPLSSFTGLSQAQVNASQQTPVTFTLQREAGTLSFEGTFKAGFGAGQFVFTPNPAFLDTVRSLGVAVEPKKTRHLGRPSEDRLMQLALQDVSTSFIREMQVEGYRVALDDYLAFRIFRVTPQLVRDLRTLGFDDLSSDQLVQSQIHRVTPDYIRAMRAAGFQNLSMRQLMQSGIHGVDPEYVRQIREAGYGNLGLEQLTQFRIHGVTPEYIRQLREVGYDQIPANKLSQMRIHGVTAQFIRDLEAAGYRDIPVEKLIAMRIHGVTAEFVKRMNSM